jgi:hypothetical protein
MLIGINKKWWRHNNFMVNFAPTVLTNRNLFDQPLNDVIEHHNR